MDYIVAGTATPNSTLNIQLSDGSTTINRTVTTDGDGHFSIPINVSSLSDGTIDLNIQAISPFGNKGQMDKHTILKDTVAPHLLEVKIDSYINKHNMESFLIEGTTEDGRVHTIIEFSDGENTITTDTLAENGSFHVNVDLSSLKDGPIAMTLIQTDEAGNKRTTEMKTIEKDTAISNPVVNRSGYAFSSGAIVYNLVGTGEPFSIITVHLVDENGNVIKEINHEVGLNGVYHIDIPMDEAYSVSIIQTDHAGNESEIISPVTLSHTVESGENLSLIAKHYNTTVEAIKRLNRLNGDTIYPNQQLYLPVSASATVNLGYMYFGDVKSFTNQVLRTERSFNIVSPSYFDLNQDGSLRLTHLVDAQFVENMHQQGIRVVPFLSNHWDREVGRAMLNNYEATAQQIADAVMKYNLDGVNVDIENITHDDREQFTAFVKLLRELLPTSKEVSVAVAANPNG
ncbi:LysM repeat protein [Gracilibacillus halotolerans]|uniref:mannosyl-glycoprotein endo-beta-N-acetylglucosaminidase n=1 Tax=Gracilibacillus halotolerans TaxID=74386 RepID=A0A841RMX1_9BACI|nr:LysM peptidoglycan-binding domain-containing protein [Gracilibacillus halotolerans]MBB6512786.1 LysM repeat protein [Gracilibacillus halotolerans]